MQLSEIGSIASQYWMEIPKHFYHVKLDEFIIMPNHLHGIIILDYSLVGPHHGMALPMHHDVTCHHKNEFSKPLKNSVSIIVNQFKSSLKRWCNKNGYVDFEWQSRFYDHIINDQTSMENVRAYIKNNPTNWSGDDLFF
jgi:REP element-mobilizing transposase RayT